MLWNMSKTMKALVYDRRKAWETSKGLWLQEVPEPTLNPQKDVRDAHQALVRPLFAGFCGSDRNIWFRRAFKDMIVDSLDAENQDLRIIGHELVGRVEALGPEAERAFGLRPNDIVSAESHIICGVCYQCRLKDTHVCADDKILGISQDGCFAPLVKLPAKALWRTNVSKIRLEVAATQEPFGNAVHACTKVNLRGQSVAIIGCGTIGLLSIVIARALGARKIIAVEPGSKNQSLAKKLGADLVLAPQADPHGFIHDPELDRKIKDVTDGVGVDVALEMSGVNSAVNNAIEAVRRGGNVILFGLKAGACIIEHFDRLIVDGISLHSVIGRRIWETWHITQNLLEGRSPNIHDAIWDTLLEKGQNTVFSFHDFEPDRFEEAISTHPKVLLKFEE